MAEHDALLMISRASSLRCARCLLGTRIIPQIIPRSARLAAAHSRRVVSAQDGSGRPMCFNGLLRRSFERRRSVCSLDFAARRPSEPRPAERSQSRTERLARWLHGHRPPHTLQLVSSGGGVSSKNRCAPHPPSHLLFRLMGRSLRGDRTSQLQPSAGRGVRRATPSSRRLSISPF